MACAHYVERIQHWRQIQEIIVKDGAAKLPPPERNAQEAQKILSHITPSDVLICLDEKGKNYTSKEFSRFLAQISENSTQTPCFVLGGAFGLTDAVRNKSKHLLALGSMTFPHELARVLLLEQIYRAECILRSIPYHHD